SLTSSATGFEDLLNTTHSWPPFRSRRTMFEPIRPRPIIPSCMRRTFPWSGWTANGHSLAASAGSLARAIPPDQRVGRAVMLGLRLRCALELRNDPLGEHLAQLHAPLVEGVDLPDGALGEDAVLIECDQLAERTRCQAIEQDGV